MYLANQRISGQDNCTFLLTAYDPAIAGMFAIDSFFIGLAIGGTAK